MPTSALFEESYTPTGNYDISSLGLAKPLEDYALSFIGQVPSEGQVASTVFSGDEMNKLKYGYRKIFDWYLQQRDLRELFTGDAFEGTILTAFIVKQQLKGKSFGGINPSAGQFGFSLIRPESWYATFHAFSSTAVTDVQGTGPANLAATWTFQTPASTGWSSSTAVPAAGNQLFWVNTQLTGSGLLQLRDNVAFYVPWLADENPSAKISEIEVTFNQKPSFPVSLHDLVELNLNIFRLPQDWFIGINSALFQVIAKIRTASASDALKPLGLQYSTAEYGILLV
jgi:hypothetical protein